MDLQSALAYFLPQTTDDLRADVLAALREASKRRLEGPQATGALIAALRDDFDMSLREIERESHDPETGATITHTKVDRLYQQAKGLRPW